MSQMLSYGRQQREQKLGRRSRAKDKNEMMFDWISQRLFRARRHSTVKGEAGMGVVGGAAVVETSQLMGAASVRNTTRASGSVKAK